jgi:hypothetical protein
MAAQRAAQNRAIRQDALREWLSKKCTAQHLVDNIIKIEGLDTSDENFQNELAKYKVANEQRLRILDKYLPSLKSTELTTLSEDGEVTGFKVELVRATKPSDT